MIVFNWDVTSWLVVSSIISISIIGWSICLIIIKNTQNTDLFLMIGAMLLAS
jgi:hypothetical protein